MAVAFMGGVILAELLVFKMAVGAAARNGRIEVAWRAQAGYDPAAGISGPRRVATSAWAYRCQRRGSRRFYRRSAA
jgi:hypothetical protein